METMTAADATTPTIPTTPIYRQRAQQQAAERLTQARERYPRISRAWVQRVCLIPPDQRPAVVGPGKRGRRQ